MPTKGEWFEIWFNSPYYHILYKDRNYIEAERFITSLLEYLKLPEGVRCLDLACGKGRHSIFLNQKGLDVIGLDLAEANIAYAKKFENETLHFEVHDMREVFKTGAFDVVFNLFTSFGYFEEFSENEKVLNAINEMLVPGGKLVFDYMNCCFIKSNLIEKEIKTVQGIDFHITRFYDGVNIVKTIQFEDKGEEYSFREEVQAIKKEEMDALLRKTGFEIIDHFGDFDLEPFDSDQSERLIIIAQKK